MAYRELIGLVRTTTALVALSVLIANGCVVRCPGSCRPRNGRERLGLKRFGCLRPPVPWDRHLVHALIGMCVHPCRFPWPTIGPPFCCPRLRPFSLLALPWRGQSAEKWVHSGRFAGSVLMGAGISSMHYIGMAAMRYGYVPIHSFSSPCPSCSPSLFLRRVMDTFSLFEMRKPETGREKLAEPW